MTEIEWFSGKRMEFSPLPRAPSYQNDMPLVYQMLRNPCLVHGKPMKLMINGKEKCPDLKLYSIKNSQSQKKRVNENHS